MLRLALRIVEFPWGCWGWKSNLAKCRERVSDIYDWWYYGLCSQKKAEEEQGECRSAANKWLATSDLRCRYAYCWCSKHLNEPNPTCHGL